MRADKIREAGDGHDGTWVAHPALVSLAREAFDSKVAGDNQLDRLREDVEISASDLLEVPAGTRTEQGLRLNIRVGIRYLEAWLRGVGCVPLYHLMEDAATAEISRTQIWQWLHHGAEFDDGRTIDRALVTRVRITSGRYAGNTDVVSSNVFQKTEDFPEEAAQAVHVILGDDSWVTVGLGQVELRLCRSGK